MTDYAHIHSAFAEQVRRHPDAILFDLPDGSTRTYAETADTAHRIAARLIDAGVTPGNRVAAQVDKSPEAIALYLATLQIGAVYLPLNTAYTAAEVDYFLGDATPRVFVCTPQRAQEFAARINEHTVIETLGTAGDGTILSAQRVHADAHASTDDDPAAILYTSGTTGRSKGAVLTHANLASNCAALQSNWQYTRNDRLIHALPIFHIHGLFVAANLTLTTGARMHFLSKFNVDTIVDLMPSSTVLMGVPTFYTRLAADEGLTPEKCSQMRLFVSGSAPLLATDHEAFHARTGHAILERYGMTETGMNAANPYDGERKPGTVGHALPGVDIRITDKESGTPITDGGVGAIEVKGPNVFAGYWNMPEKTAAEFRSDGYFITGDMGRFDEDGYLCIVGRDKDMIISGGFNVYPAEVEKLLDEHPAVVESAVIGVPHPDLGETVVAVVVTSETLDTDELVASVADRLARFKQPRAVRIVTELPRNVMGKVQKAQLRTQFSDIFAATGK